MGDNGIINDFGLVEFPVELMGKEGSFKRDFNPAKIFLFTVHSVMYTKETIWIVAYDIIVYQGGVNEMLLLNITEGPQTGACACLSLTVTKKCKFKSLSNICMLCHELYGPMTSLG